MSDASPSGENGPNYDVEITADELLTELADLAREYAADHDEKRQWWRESFDMVSEFTEARYWMLEALGGRRAVADAMVQIQRGGESRNTDGTVNVRAFMRYCSDQADRAHERSYGDYTETRQADEAETAYCRILSLIRDDYGVGWPRLDDLGGNPLKCDLP